MTTKILNKLVNVCTNLSGGTTSGTTDSSSGDIYVSFICTLIEGTEYLSASISTSSSPLEFNVMDKFDASLFGQFNIIIQGGQTAVVTYSGSLFKITSGLGVASTFIAVDISGVGFPFTATITDTSDNVLSKYIISKEESVNNLNSTEILQLIYPVGSIYTSIYSTSPADFFLVLVHGNKLLIASCIVLILVDQLVVHQHYLKLIYQNILTRLLVQMLQNKYNLEEQVMVV